jgi:hypothetical protein
MEEDKRKARPQALSSIGFEQVANGGKPEGRGGFRV